ncbi:hypothetical protein BD779DRAFT_842116 [Infundibulicybe gibba]|nr:hypothetical protein BD779DRAFT_842116 [Infundibulicybe gibba]
MNSLCTRSPPPHGERTGTPSHPKPTQHPYDRMTTSSTSGRRMTPRTETSRRHRSTGRRRTNNLGSDEPTPRPVACQPVHHPRVPLCLLLRFVSVLISRNRHANRTHAALCHFSVLVLVPRPRRSTHSSLTPLPSNYPSTSPAPSHERSCE